MQFKPISCFEKFPRRNLKVKSKNLRKKDLRQGINMQQGTSKKVQTNLRVIHSLSSSEWLPRIKAEQNYFLFLPALWHFFHVRELEAFFSLSDDLNSYLYFFSLKPNFMYNTARFPKLSEL